MICVEILTHEHRELLVWTTVPTVALTDEIRQWTRDNGIPYSIRHIPDTSPYTGAEVWFNTTEEATLFKYTWM